MVACDFQFRPPLIIFIFFRRKTFLMWVGRWVRQTSPGCHSAPLPPVTPSRGPPSVPESRQPQKSVDRDMFHDMICPVFCFEQNATGGSSLAVGGTGQTVCPPTAHVAGRPLLCQHLIEMHPPPPHQLPPSDLPQVDFRYTNLFIWPLPREVLEGGEGGGRGSEGGREGGGSAGPSLLLWSPYGPRRRRATNFEA